MRRVPLLAMLAVVFGVLVSPSAAAPAEGILLRGSRSAYVDLYVYVNRTVSLPDVTMKTKGTFVGFYMSPAPANRDTVGALVMPRVGATGVDAASTMQLGQSFDVQAGKYRVFLLTDGPAEVFIPIEGQGYRGWTPRGRAPLSVRPTNFDINAGDTQGAVHTPVALRERSLIVSAGVASSTSLTAVDEISACISDTASCASSYASDSTPRVPFGRAWSHGATLQPPGRYTALLQLNRLVAGVDAASHVEGVVIVLTIGRQT